MNGIETIIKSLFLLLDIIICWLKALNDHGDAKPQRENSFPLHYTFDLDSCALQEKEEETSQQAKPSNCAVKWI